MTEAGVVLKSLETTGAKADTVILAVGFKPDDSLFNQMQDADRSTPSAMQPVQKPRDAHEVANHL